MILQIIYLLSINDLDVIAIFSMIFSIISIIITIVSKVTEKQILDDTGYGIIKFDVTGSMVTNTQNYRNQTKTIRNEISNVLGLKANIVEIVRPTKIPNGLQFIINIHLKLIQSRDIDYQQLLNKCQKSGRLAEIIKSAWKLEQVPSVSSIQFVVQESKDRIKNTVPIKVESVSPRQIDNHRNNNVQYKSAPMTDINGSVELEPMPQINNINMMKTPGMDDGDSSESDGNKTKGSTIGFNNNDNDDDQDIINDINSITKRGNNNDEEVIKQINAMTNKGNTITHDPNIAVGEDDVSDEDDGIFQFKT